MTKKFSYTQSKYSAIGFSESIKTDCCYHYNNKLFEFALTFKCKDITTNTENYLDILFENKFDDSLIGIGELGSFSIGLERSGISTVSVIDSAINDVLTCIDDVTVSKIVIY